jgi:hypothetical protein
MKNLFRSNINHLIKVRNKIHNSQKMSGSQVILSETNQYLLIEAENKIQTAINILESIQ